MAPTRTGPELAREIRGAMKDLQYEEEKGFVNPFSILVERLCEVKLAIVEELRRPPGKTVRLALVSMPELPWSKRRFSTLRVPEEEAPDVDPESCSRVLVAYRGDAPKRLFAAFEEALQTTLVRLGAHVVCVSELGFPSGNLLPFKKAMALAHRMSHKYPSLVVAGSAHDSRTLYNTGRLFYPGCDRYGWQFHKAVSAVSVGELVSVPSYRRVLGVKIYGLSIATMICLDIADYASLAAVVRLGDLVDMILVPCYTRKFEKMLEIAKVASKALPGIVALANANLEDSMAGQCRVARFDRLVEPTEILPLASGAIVSLFDLDYDTFQEERTKLKTAPDNQMEWLFGRRDRPVLFQ